MTWGPNDTKVEGQDEDMDYMLMSSDMCGANIRSLEYFDIQPLPGCGVCFTLYCRSEINMPTAQGLSPTMEGSA
jgi:hypothetical protein